jgi:5-methylcytosine-specific restriction enzyme A
MPKLSTLSGIVAALPPRLGFAADLQSNGRRARDKIQHWRRWYKTSQWQKLRWSVLVRDLFTCKRCNRIEQDTSLLVADHRVPHRGDAKLFWDADNLQCLCKACHDSAKQAEEKAGRFGGR